MQNLLLGLIERFFHQRDEVFYLLLAHFHAYHIYNKAGGYGANVLYYLQPVFFKGSACFDNIDYTVG